MLAEMSLDQLFLEYRRRKLRSASPQTITQYEVTLRHAAAVHGGPVLLSDLSNDFVLDVMHDLSRRGRSPASANKQRSNLIALWNYACRKGLLTTWPDVEPLPEPKRSPLAWTPDQLQRLFAACSRADGWIGVVPAASWWHCLHAVIWDTGERISAVMALRWDDIDMQSGWIVIPGEFRKGKTEDKASRLHPDTIAAMRVIESPQRTLVFPFPFNRAMLWHRYRELLKAAGLPSDRKHKFHCLRKSVASYFEAAGGNATELLGHSSRAVTAAYLDPRILSPKQASDVLFRPGC